VLLLIINKLVFLRYYQFT